MSLDNDDFIGYLSAKTSIDDRSINPRLWQSFVGHLKRMRQDGTVSVAE